MARRCKTNEYRLLVEQARRQVKDINITTDIIVGFPGETDAEWQQTLDFIQEIGFAHLHSFAYSPRKGTKAAQLSDPVSREVKRLRSEALHELGEKMKRKTLQGYVGRTLPVLIEGSRQSGWGGYTPNYLRVEIGEVPHRELSNSILDVELTGLTADQSKLEGRAVFG